MNEDSFVLLLPSGASSTCVIMAWRCGTCFKLESEEVVQYDGKALLEATNKGHERCVEALLKTGADVNESYKGVYNETALLIAIENDYDTCAEHLLEAGAEANATGKLQQDTALMVATKKGNAKSVDILLKAEADVNHVNQKNGHTALFYAILRNDHKCVNLLINAGAAVNIIDNNNDTPLLASLRVGSTCVKTVALLIQAGADVNVTDSIGGTPLMKASRGASIETVRLLLAGGAQINQPKGWCRISFGPNNFNKHIMEELSLLLFAAGETLHTKVGKQYKIPGYVRDPESPSPPYLKHLCRKSLRAHMIKMPPPTNLLVKISELELPSLLKKYLLFGVSLESVEDMLGKVSV